MHSSISDLALDLGVFALDNEIEEESRSGQTLKTERDRGSQN